MSYRVFGCLLLALTVVAGVAGGDPVPVAPPPRESRIGELVRRLGSEDFREREDATRQLAALDLPEPPPELVRALQSPNPEVRQRAEQAIRAIRQRAIDPMLKPGRTFAAGGRVDLFVAATAAWKLEADDDRLWQPALDLAHQVVKKAEYSWWPPEDCKRAFSSMAEFRKSFNPRFIRADQPHQQEKVLNGFPLGRYPGGIMAPGVSSPVALGNNIIVSRGEVRAVTRLGSSIAYANGDVTAGTLNGLVLICDGNVTVKDHIEPALVIARGNIQAGSYASRSFLVAGGSVKLGKPDPLGGKIWPCVVKENETNPLGYITFFELSTVGVEVKVVDKAVQVSAVTNGQPFAKAGVRVGDVVTEVNGKKPDSAESLRRLLRDALAIGDATVKLRRGDKTETVKVALPE
jgi:hypothetical protein